MIKKKITLLLVASTLAISALFTGCGAKDEVEKAGDAVEDSVEKAGDAVENGAEDVKEGAENLWDKVTDRTMDYSKGDFVKALEENNVKPSKIDKIGSLFSVEGEYYQIDNGALIGVYEYAETDESEMNTDISSIKNNGMMIGDNDITWDDAVHIYKKGRIIVVYDGSDTDTLNLLTGILGGPILG